MSIQIVSLSFVNTTTGQYTGIIQYGTECTECGKVDAGLTDYSELPPQTYQIYIYYIYAYIIP